LYGTSFSILFVEIAGDWAEKEKEEKRTEKPTNKAF